MRNLIVKRIKTEKESEHDNKGLNIDEERFAALFERLVAVNGKRTSYTRSQDWTSFIDEDNQKKIHENQASGGSCEMIRNGAEIFPPGSKVANKFETWPHGILRNRGS